MEKKWNVFGISRNLDEVKEVLLRQRGFPSLEEAQEFLKLDHPLNYIRKFPTDFKKSLKDAKKLIQENIQAENPILIHGDYDADGVCASSILYNYFSKELGYEKTFYFIPNRFDHGYGLSRESIEEALEMVKAKTGDTGKILFITVDSGITSKDEVAYLKEKDHDVIITDHHQKPKELPLADVIVWSDQIVGAAIAWLLARVLGSKESDNLALATLATITDVYPLKGINRAIVKRGLESINKSPPLGLKELIKTSGIKDKELDTYHLGWVLGPRINATGRISNASKSVELFTTLDSRVAQAAASYLSDINRKRQDETNKMYNYISDLSPENRFILVHNSDFHEGIIGLVASRLVRKFYRPSIVISTNDKVGKGSVRSIEGINIIEILREFEDLFVDLGGHPMAAGFTIPIDQIENLENSLANVFSSRFKNDIFIPSVDVDVEMPLSLVDWDLFNFIQELKPFGEGNRPPLFLSRSLKAVNINFVGRDKSHTSLKLSDGTRFQKAIYFNSRDQFENISLGDRVDVVYSIKENNYRGNRSLDLFVKDIRLSS